jgi:hypothetical protein
MNSFKLSEYVENLYDNAEGILTDTFDIWSKGIEYELTFWRKWFRTKGDRWPEDYQRRLLPQPLMPHLVALLPPRETLHCLDVGSGPISKVGSFIPGRDGTITACDPPRFGL